MAGTVTISIEIELGWGVVKYGALDKLSPNREQETRYLHRLLDACDTHNVPISFDIVGHLLLDSCDGHPDSPHDSGWWDDDPESSIDEAPEFYAPDIADAIREADVDHELSTHTFSHIEGDRVSDDVVNWELSKVTEAHRQAGHPTPSSIVTPRHRHISPDLLTEHDLTIQRTVPPNAPELSKAELLLDIVRDSHPVRPPETIDGVTRTYSKSFGTLTTPMLARGQSSPHRLFDATPLSLRQWHHSRLLTKSLQRTVAQDSYAHYWCHLYDLANSEQFPQIEAFIEALGNTEEADVLTMAELNKQWRAGDA